MPMARWGLDHAVITFHPAPSRWRRWCLRWLGGVRIPPAERLPISKPQNLGRSLKIYQAISSIFPSLAKPISWSSSHPVVKGSEKNVVSTCCPALPAACARGLEHDLLDIFKASNEKHWTSRSVAPWCKIAEVRLHYSYLNNWVLCAIRFSQRGQNLNRKAAQPLRNWSLSCQVFDEASGSQESELPSHASTNDTPQIRSLQADPNFYKTGDPY